MGIVIPNEALFFAERGDLSRHGPINTGRSARATLA
jgi:hypothetical protein